MLIVPMLDQGGLERVCAATAQLLKNDYDVHLVVFNTAGMIYDVSGIDLIDLKLGAAEGRIGKALNVLKRVRRVKKLKKQMKIDLSYSFGPTANIVNVLSKRGEITWAGIRGYGALNSRCSMKLICRLADRVVGCTKVMEQQIKMQFNPKKTAAIYNPCDIAHIREQSAMATPAEFEGFFARKGKTVVSMGREHDVKGFWHLIKAVHLARKGIPDLNLKLMIIGAGGYKEYKELAYKLGMGDDVLFTGVRKNPFALLAKSDIYALTSESEGFPNALIEAMACGIPCISANCLTGPAEILHEDYMQCDDREQVFCADYGVLTGVFHGDKDMDADHFTKEEEKFADELKKMFNDADMYMHYKRIAPKRAEDFGMDEYLKNICKLIEEDV